jgi:predicted peptidase
MAVSDTAIEESIDLQNVSPSSFSNDKYLTVSSNTLGATTQALLWSISADKHEQKDGATLPLVVFLHGGYGKGDDLTQVLRFGLPQLLNTYDGNLGELIATPTYVLAPQCPGDLNWSAPEMQDRVIAMIDDAIAHFNIDVDRLYITGVSMGGIGTWSLLGRYSTKFAAAIPMSGGGPSNQVPVLKEKPM